MKIGVILRKCINNFYLDVQSIWQLDGAFNVGYFSLKLDGVGPVDNRQSTD